MLHHAQQVLQAVSKVGRRAGHAREDAVLHHVAQHLVLWRIGLALLDALDLAVQRDLRHVARQDVGLADGVHVEQVGRVQREDGEGAREAVVEVVAEAAAGHGAPLVHAFALREQEGEEGRLDAHAHAVQRVLARPACAGPGCWGSDGRAVGAGVQCAWLGWEVGSVAAGAGC